jgi:hypothetical protein
MSATEPTISRAAASTVLITDLSIDAPTAGVVLNALYSGPGGTPPYRGWDSRAFRSFCEARLGATNTQAFFSAIGVEY